MRRYLIAAAVAALVVIGAAPASAQRDPFEPLVSEESGAVTGSSGVTTAADPDVVPVAPAGRSDVLADTGIDPQGFFAAAFALIVLGGYAVGAAALRRSGPALARSRG